MAWGFRSGTSLEEVITPAVGVRGGFTLGVGLRDGILRVEGRNVYDFVGFILGVESIPVIKGWVWVVASTIRVDGRWVSFMLGVEELSGGSKFKLTA